jgi:hypothetical protein
MSAIQLMTDDPDQARMILSEALETEKLRLHYSLQLAQKRLSRFEEKYSVNSEKFIAEWVAEDLEGKDMEYVEWAGEYKLASQLTGRLQTITGIVHVTS